MNRNIILDTSFWIALFTENDAYHETAYEIYEKFAFNNIIVPWPTMFELLRERFLKDKIALVQLKTALTNPKVKFIDDEPYRDNALEETFNSTLERNWKVSLTDNIIKSMIIDSSLKIDVIASTNNRDFDEVVKRAKIEYYYI